VPGTPAARPWWRRPWIVPLGFLVLGFLFMSWSAYWNLDPGTSRVVLRDGFALHYPVVIGHVLFGSIAIGASVLQIWPWLRERHPAAHRRIGRLYVFGGVLPTGLLALVLTPFSHGPAGNGVTAVLWLVTTVAGFRAIRRGDRTDHRMWMVYSFALTLSIVWGRVMFVTLPMIPAFDMADPATMARTFETAAWIGTVVNLLIAWVWLRRTERRDRRPVAA
jgi:uncharacterized membrane protein YozB (DUF420 family)